MTDLPPCRGCKHLINLGMGQAPLCAAVTMDVTDFYEGTVKPEPVQIHVARQPLGRCGMAALLREPVIPYEHPSQGSTRQ